MPKKPPKSPAPKLDLVDPHGISMSFPIFQKSSTEKVMKASAGRHMYRFPLPASRQQNEKPWRNKLRYPLSWSFRNVVYGRYRYTVSVHVYTMNSTCAVYLRGCTGRRNPCDSFLFDCIDVPSDSIPSNVH